MKSATFILGLCVYALLPSMVPKHTLSQTKSNKDATDYSAMSWEEIVKSYLRDFPDPDKPATIAYTNRIKTLLDRKGVSHIQGYGVLNGKRGFDFDIYYTAGELHVTSNQKMAWNVVVKNGKVYEWRIGESEGIVHKAIAKDMIDYLIYVTDVAMIPTSIHKEFLTEPQLFHSPKQIEKDGWVELRLKKPNEVYSAVFISEEPFWIFGFEQEQNTEGKSFKIIHSKPKTVPKVPESITKMMDGIEFEESKKTLRRHFVFL